VYIGVLSFRMFSYVGGNLSTGHVSIQGIVSNSTRQNEVEKRPNELVQMVRLRLSRGLLKSLHAKFGIVPRNRL
jgi:hypothetical protein